MSKPINAAYLERKLRAIIGVQGSNPLPNLEDVNGLLVLENDRPEWSLPANEMLLFYSAFSVQAVGEFSYVAFTNPTGSGILAIFEKFKSVPTSAGGAVQSWIPFYDVDSTALAGVLNTQHGIFRDLRAIPVGGSIIGGAIVTETGNDPTPSATAVSTAMVVPGSQSPNAAETWLDSVIVPPGRRLLMVSGAANTAIAVYASWRERPIEGKFEMR